MSLWLRRRDLRTHLYIATVIKFLATYVYIFPIFFLIFLLDFIIVMINLIQLLDAILIRINYLSIYLSIYLSKRGRALKGGGERGIWARESLAPSSHAVSQPQFPSLSNACHVGYARGGGTLEISGWGCAAGTLEPLTYTRTSSAEFCHPILE